MLELPSPILILGAVAAMSLLPFAAMTLTSFVKISIVLSLIRTGIGTPQSPANVVITGLSLALTVVVMTPVLERCTEELTAALTNEAPLASDDDASQSLERALSAVTKGAEPLLAFLERHSQPADRAMLAGLTARLDPERPARSPEHISVLLPAFIISELQHAFRMGFVLFIPFLVVDLVVANLLMALGMQMMAPMSVSLPFKLLLFVAVDGWSLVVRSLLESYAA